MEPEEGTKSPLLHLWRTLVAREVPVLPPPATTGRLWATPNIPRRLWPPPRGLLLSQVGCSCEEFVRVSILDPYYVCYVGCINQLFLRTNPEDPDKFHKCRPNLSISAPTFVLKSWSIYCKSLSIPIRIRERRTAPRMGGTPGCQRSHLLREPRGPQHAVEPPFWQRGWRGCRRRGGPGGGDRPVGRCGSQAAGSARPHQSGRQPLPGLHQRLCQGAGKCSTVPSLISICVSVLLFAETVQRSQNVPFHLNLHFNLYFEVFKMGFKLGMTVI